MLDVEDIEHIKKDIDKALPGELNVCFKKLWSPNFVDLNCDVSVSWSRIAWKGLWSSRRPRPCSRCALVERPSERP